MKRTVTLTCYFCKDTFQKDFSLYNSRIKSGAKKFFCKKECCLRDNQLKEYLKIRKQELLESSEDRFWENYKINNITNCWEWQRAKDANGYGLLSFRGQFRKAHHVSYQLKIGDKPPELLIRHTCHNPSCINPEHLLIGTCKDNTKDMVEAGRSKCVGLKGESNPSSTISDSILLDIWNKWHSGKYEASELSEEYGITRDYIYHLKYSSRLKELLIFD